MENSVTQDGITTVLSTHSFDSSSVLPEVIVQVVHLKVVGGRHKFTANDGKMQIKAMLPLKVLSDGVSGKIQNLGLIHLLDYVVNNMPGKSEEH